MSVYLSGNAFDLIGELHPSERVRVLGVLERISIKPERYLRKMIRDPAYRLRMEGFRIYLDLSCDDVVILAIRPEDLIGPGRSAVFPTG